MFLIWAQRYYLICQFGEGSGPGKGEFRSMNVQETLRVFQERIERMNVKHKLAIENIHELLIWGSI